MLASETFIRKNGNITLNDYTKDDITGLIGLCRVPGIYKVNDDYMIEHMRHVSDGTKVITELFDSDLVDGKYVFHKEPYKSTEYLLDDLLVIEERFNTINPTDIYTLVSSVPCRKSKLCFYYLSTSDYAETPEGKLEAIYKQMWIPLSAMNKILRLLQPMTRESAMKYSDKSDSVHWSKILKAYQSGDMSEFGYTNIEGNFCSLWDDMLRLEVWDPVKKNNSGSLSISYTKLKTFLDM